MLEIIRHKNVNWMVHCYIGFKQNVFWRFPKQRAHTRFLWKFSFSWRRWIPGPSVTITKCLYLTNRYTYLYETFRKVRYSYKFLFALNLNFKYKKMSICEPFESFFLVFHIYLLNYKTFLFSPSAAKDASWKGKLIDV